MPGTPRTRRGDLRLKQYWVHPEVHKRIKAEAATKGVTYSDVVHEVFCRRYRMPDLIPMADDASLS